MPESKSGALPLGDIPMYVGARPWPDTLGIIAWIDHFGNPFLKYFFAFSQTQTSSFSGIFYIKNTN